MNKRGRFTRLSVPWVLTKVLGWTKNKLDDVVDAEILAREIKISENKKHPCLLQRRGSFCIRMN